MNTKIMFCNNPWWQEKKKPNNILASILRGQYIIWLFYIFLLKKPHFPFCSLLSSIVLTGESPMWVWVRQWAMEGWTLNLGSEYLCLCVRFIIDYLCMIGYMAYCYSLSFLTFKMEENDSINLTAMLKWDSECDLAMHWIICKALTHVLES